MLESVMAVSAHGPRRGRPVARCDEGLRTARTCYDHLAGRLGVGLADALTQRGLIALDHDGGEVTATGLIFFSELSVDLRRPRRAAASSAGLASTGRNAATISQAMSAPACCAFASTGAGSRASATAAR